MATKRTTHPVLTAIAVDLANVRELTRRAAVRKRIMAEVERLYYDLDARDWRFRHHNKVYRDARKALADMAAEADALIQNIGKYRAGTRVSTWAPCRDRAVLALGELRAYARAECEFSARHVVASRPHNAAVDDCVDRVADVLAEAGLEPATGNTNILSRTLSTILPRRGIGITDVRGRVRMWQRRRSSE